MLPTNCTPTAPWCRRLVALTASAWLPSGCMSAGPEAADPNTDSLQQSVAALRARAAALHDINVI